MASATFRFVRVSWLILVFWLVGLKFNAHSFATINYMLVLHLPAQKGSCPQNEF